MSDDCASSPVIRIADAPFNDPDADIILCTADNVHFLVYKLLLSLASLVFRDMFSLPQPSDSQSNKERPVISITEGRQTVETMLKYCYPSFDPTLETLEDIQAMIEVMTKYDMQEGLKRVRKHLVSPVFLQGQPLRVFAIACRYKLKDEAILAAQHTVYHPIVVPYVQELDYIPASAYHRLLEYRNKCGDLVVALTNLNSPIWVSSPDWMRFQVQHTICPASCSNRVIPGPFSSHGIKEWFCEYLLRAKDALRSRPCPKTVADPELLRPSLEKASSCRNCSYRAYNDLNKFATVTFAQEIQRVISEVSQDYSKHFTS
jgi:hypothetical protein